MFKYLVALFFLANLALINCAELEHEKAKAGPVCEICTVVLSAAQNLLEQNKTEVKKTLFFFFSESSN